MMRVIPKWLVEYGYLDNANAPNFYHVNVDTMYEALQHFALLNHGIRHIDWLRITREAEPQSSVTYGPATTNITGTL